MNENVSNLIKRIKAMEEELELELAKLRADLCFTVEEKKLKFEQAIIEKHKKMKTNLALYIIKARPLNIFTAPVIYGIFPAFLILDIAASFYQAVCFPVYGIAKVNRKDYFIYDRELLPYLNIIEKFNCFYCSYASGVIGFVREIAARTEQYWCPIKHARRLIAAHSRYHEFVDFGDQEAYHRGLGKLRDKLKDANHKNSKS